MLSRKYIRQAAHDRMLYGPGEGDFSMRGQEEFDEFQRHTEKGPALKSIDENRVQTADQARSLMHDEKTVYLELEYWTDPSGRLRLRKKINS